MKRSVLALALTLTTFSGFAAEPISAALSTTGAFVTAMNGYDCVTKNDENQFGRCYIAMTSSTVLAAAVLKEDMAQVQPDIYNFLAGEEISLALEHQMNLIRHEIPETQEMNDQEVAAMMLEIINS